MMYVVLAGPLFEENNTMCTKPNHRRRFFMKGCLHSSACHPKGQGPKAGGGTLEVAPRLKHFKHWRFKVLPRGFLHSYSHRAPFYWWNWWNRSPPRGWCFLWDLHMLGFRFKKKNTTWLTQKTVLYSRLLCIFMAKQPIDIAQLHRSVLIICPHG